MTNAARIAKNSIRADKRSAMQALATEAEEAAWHENMKDLYTTTRKLCGKISKPETQVKNKNGKAIPGKEGQRNRWREYFAVEPSSSPGRIRHSSS